VGWDLGWIIYKSEKSLPIEDAGWAKPDQTDFAD